MQIRGVWHAVGIIRSISDRKTAARAREQLAAIVESTREAIIGKSLDGQVSSWNVGAENLYGYTAAEMIGRSIEVLVPEDLRDELAELMARLTRGEIVGHLETQRLRKDGARIDVALTLSPIYDADGSLSGISTIAHDITRRKAAERSLLRLNRRLKLLSASNQTLLHAETLEDLLERMCRAVTEVGGFQGAWIGRINAGSQENLQFLAASPPEIETAFAQGACPIEANTPLAQAIHAGKSVVFADRPPHHCLPSAHLGIVLPLKGKSSINAYLVLWTSNSDLLDDEEISTLEELAADLHFGLEGLRIKIEREHGLLAVARAMEDMVRAIAGTVEMRDPYTAGHQRRVAELSTAISRELGLAEDRVHAVGLATMIHDLGKINIPAEILTRPGRLSEIERALIKTHPGIGYDIVKDIEFPWPIAKAMLQHHERIDGSGYPSGLKGEAIILEARIIGAADLVEAMSSHRPYRPGLGIEAALDELSRGRGQTFDAEVVDACLRLFQKRGFQFSKAWGSASQ